jgi:trehalose/maltose hydrolase-like predicted phosphorylase
VTDTERPPALEEAVESLAAAAAAGYDRLLREQRAAWARRWQDVDVRIPDDPRSQLLVRYALFQLWSNVGRHDESAVGARGLSGPGYAGHVFWDADAFVLPAVVSIDPAAARAMVRYRLNRLTAARAFAAAGGHDGARFPWESAASGTDVTPHRSRLGPAEVEILTGRLEEHITADVAWGLSRYLDWTGERASTADLTLLADTARYWASRCRLDADGTAHIDAVIGPDEYHERVDDNAFTNVLARWNLRAGAAAADRLDGGRSTRWRAVADALVDGFDATTGRYEQFAGYFGLEPLLMAQVARPPVAVDLLLGRDRVSRSQLIKQPDVLMLHHLVPGEVRPHSLRANLDFYLPRTAHGSSLSPAVSAALLARAGRPDPALRMLDHALAIDVEDVTGMTESGLHLATLASVWTALLSGFAGVSVSGRVLTVDPRLPSHWGQLELRFRCLGRRVRLQIDRSAVRVGSDGPLRVRTGPGAATLVTAGGAIADEEPGGGSG